MSGNEKAGICPWSLAGLLTRGKSHDKPISKGFDFFMDDECQLILDIQRLKAIDIGDQKEVMATIEILRCLGRKLVEILLEHEVFFDESGIGTLLNLYRQSIDTL